MAEKNNRFSGMSRAELEKEARKQIVHSGLLALAALIVIAVACYAWFCSAGAVTAQGMAVRLSGYGFDLASAGDLPDLEVGMPEDYTDPTGEAYKSLTSITRDNLWVQSNNGFTLDNMNVTDFALYNGDIFSVRVTLDVNVTRTDGTIKTFPYASSLFFRKNDAGKWMCFNSTNVDVSQPVGRVRLTFMNGETEVHSQFYGTDAKEIVTPVVSTPEGKVFTGWVTIDQDENGAKVYNLQFQPDDEGKVSIPDGVTLKPMTLYALFQNPGEQTTIPTASAETTGETTAETTAATEGA